MPKLDSESSLLASVLDRLLDEQPTQTREPPLQHRQDVWQLKKTIARDLEALLNTRTELLDELPDGEVEVAHSLLTYGLPDLTAMSIADPRERNRVRRAIERAIEIFEPRLKNVRVALDPARGRETLLHFRIQAVIPVQPTPEAVMFDTDLQIDSKRYVVRG